MESKISDKDFPAIIGWMGATELNLRRVNQSGFYKPPFIIANASENAPF